MQSEVKQRTQKSHGFIRRFSRFRILQSVSFHPIIQIRSCCAITLCDRFLGKTIRQQTLDFWSKGIQLTFTRSFGTANLHLLSFLERIPSYLNMQLTQFIDLSLRVFIYLARLPEPLGVATITEITEYHKIPRRHLVKMPNSLAN